MSVVFLDTVCQSVQLPERFQLETSEVYLKRVGRSVLLIPKDADPWDVMAESLEQFTGDFMQDRAQPAGQIVTADPQNE